MGFDKPPTYTESGKLPLPSLPTLTGENRRDVVPQEFMAMLNLLRQENRDRKEYTPWTVAERQKFGNKEWDFSFHFEPHPAIPGLWTETLTMNGEEVHYNTRNGKPGVSDPNFYDGRDLSRPF